MGMNHRDPQWQSLVTAHIEGRLDAAQHAHLSALIQGDAAFRAEYVRQMRLDGLLTFTGRGLTAARTPSHPFTRQQSGPLFKWSSRAAVLASLLALGTLWGSFFGVPVQIVSTRQAYPAMSSGAGTQRWRHFRMEQGEATVRLPSGVQLDLVAPVEIRFLSAAHVRVIRGRVTADVGENGTGFVMDTPHMRVVDLGTRFGVDASASSHTDVVVLKGKVELYQGNDNARVATLNQGEGLRVEGSKRMSRIVSVNGLDDSDAWIQFPAASGGPTISAVSDNLSGHQPSLRNFYRIVSGGLRNGAPAFADEEDRWEKVHPALVGADLVRTFAIDAYNWWLQISLTLERPAEVFVFVDTRNPLPDWLRADFVDTGETMALDFIPSQTPGRVAERLTYAIWKRTVLAPGTLTLGAPYSDPPEDRKSFKPNRMYGVAARPIP
jgi:ferric-dicitrate binding protein FerR (iron transport regulator)